MAVSEGKWCTGSGPWCRSLRGNIHLWITFPEKIHDETLLSSYWKFMTPDEKVRCERFRFRKHRHEFLVSRGLIRSVLGRYLDTPPHLLQFENNAYGKPELFKLHQACHLFFNLSHTNGLIVLGISDVRELGVDAEDRSRSVSISDIAGSFFSPAEANAIRSLSGKSAHHRFFDYWTLKESYIKATGKGLSTPLDRFTFFIPEKNAITVSFDPELNDKPHLWQFFLVHPTNIHTVAIAIRREFSSPYGLVIRKCIPLKEEILTECPMQT